MKRSDRRNSNNACDINSISPPAVQFAIGTPPSVSLAGIGRIRSASGSSLSETPPNPPPCNWQISPSATAKFPHHSPTSLRRSGMSTPSLPNSALAKFPALGSPTMLTENNNNPLVGTRAFTLPEMAAGANGYSLMHSDSKNGDDHPITFYAPELPAETLLDVSLIFYINLLCF